MRLTTIMNYKIGLSAHWSLPAITTCPGRTKICSKHCYAINGRYRTKKVQQALQRNLELSKLPQFRKWMTEDVRNLRKVNIFRIHPSGDFYSVKYLRDWIRIAKANPQMKFWAYTRSWSIQKFLDSLKEFASLPNIRLWASIDQDNEHLTIPTFMRRCFMSIDDKPSTKKMDLIFRNEYFPKDGKKRNVKVVKKIDGVQVCPLETGVKVEGLTCQTCRICIDK